MKTIIVPPALVSTWLWLAQSNEEKALIDMAKRNLETIFKSIEDAKIYATNHPYHHKNWDG